MKREKRRREKKVSQKINFSKMICIEHVEHEFERMAAGELFVRLVLPTNGGYRDFVREMHRELFSDVLAWIKRTFPDDPSALLRYERLFRRTYDEYLRREEIATRAMIKTTLNQLGTCDDCVHFLPNFLERELAVSSLDDVVLELLRKLKPRLFRQEIEQRVIEYLQKGWDCERESACRRYRVREGNLSRPERLSLRLEKGLPAYCKGFKLPKDYHFINSLNRKTGRQRKIKEFQEDIRDDVYLSEEIMAKTFRKIETGDYFFLGRKND